jgi:hypothetical protein
MLAFLVAAAISADPTPKGLTLTGVAKDKAGCPVLGATVFVRTALYAAAGAQLAAALPPLGHPLGPR